MNATLTQEVKRPLTINDGKMSFLDWMCNKIKNIHYSNLSDAINSIE